VHDLLIACLWGQDGDVLDADHFARLRAGREGWGAAGMGSFCYRYVCLWYAGGLPADV